MLKEPFELSLWDVKNGEKKIAVLASNTMDSLASAYQVNFRENINGERILTFSIHQKYIDENGVEVENPFYKYMVNETTLKLRLGEPYEMKGETLEEQVASIEELDDEEKWIDFVIKDVNENSGNYLTQVTAKEKFVNELGKNGRSILLNTELENNYGTNIELAEKILDGSDWVVDQDSYIPVELIDEPLLITQLTKDIIVHRATWGDSEDITIPAGNFIYLFYSQLRLGDKWYLNTEKIQLLFKGEYDYFRANDLDDNYKIIDDDQIYNYEIDSQNLESALGDIIVTGMGNNPWDMVHLTGHRIEKLQKSSFNSKLNQYVFEWDVLNEEIPVKKAYSYTETDYSKVVMVTNLITNSTRFQTNQGWIPTEDKADKHAILQSFPRLEESTSISSKITNYLHFNFADNNFYSNKIAFPNTISETYTPQLVKDDVYVLRFKGRFMTIRNNYNDTNILTSDLPALNFQINTRDAEGKTAINFAETTFTFDKEISTEGEQKGYPKIPEDASYEYRTDYDNNLNQLFVDEQGYYYQYIQIKETSQVDKDVLYFEMHGTNKEQYKLYIEDIQLFKYVQGGISIDLENKETIETVIFPTDPVISLVKEEEIFFYQEGDEIIYLSKELSNYAPVYEYNYGKVRGIEVAQSNYFNNIQSLAELFEVWVKFKTNHQKNGYLWPDGKDGIRTKVIKFSKYTPNGDVINYAGIKKGINLNSINRIVNSDEIATKVIVDNNSQEYAVDGMCSITRATANPTGENEIYNFNYFIEKDLIDKQQLEQDLYGEDGLYLLLRTLNDEYDFISKAYTNNLSTQMDYQSQEIQYNAIVTSLTEEVKKQEALLSQYNEEDNTYQSISISKDQNKANLESYTDLLKKVKTNLDLLNQEIAEQEKFLATITYEKKNIKDKFHKKYQQFILEGSWQDEEYYDDNLYYLDGLKVAETSAYPKVEYQIAAAEISQLPEYKIFENKVGVRTYIEDPDFFGYRKDIFDGIEYKTPKKIEVIISERNRILDNVNASTLTVRNYKNQFEELFQKLTASNQALEYASGTYERAANSILPGGGISAKALEKGFANTPMKLNSTTNDSFVWDTQTGIIMKNIDNPNQMIQIIGNGLFCSNDGGVTWRTGVTGEGIHADLVTTGQLDVSKVNLLNKGEATFIWDKDGLKAYRLDGNNKVNANSYMNYNQFGIYGTDMGSHIQEEFVRIDASNIENKHEEKLQVIKDSSSFSLTWDGLVLNEPIINNNDDRVRLVLEPGVFKIVTIESTGQEGEYVETLLFGVNEQGGVELNGSNTTGDGLIITNGKLGKWIIDEEGIAYNKEYNGYGSIFFRPESPDETVYTKDPSGNLSQDVDDVILKCGDGFVVTNDGTMFSYAGFLTNCYVNGSILPRPEIDSNIGTAAAPFTEGYAQAWTNTSSRKVKDNIENITTKDYNLDLMNPVKFNYKNNPSIQHLGFIAEEMAEACPIVVSFDERKKPVGINYGEITAIAINEIKELRAEIESLKIEIAELKKEKS